MSVLLKIKKPEDCKLCPLFSVYRCEDVDEKVWTVRLCNLSKHIFDVWQEDTPLPDTWLDDIKPDSCPMIELPVHHGRLIDADALEEERWDADTRCGYVQVVDVGTIQDAPTIIEAE